MDDVKYCLPEINTLKWSGNLRVQRLAEELSGSILLTFPNSCNVRKISANIQGFEVSIYQKRVGKLI